MALTLITDALITVAEFTLPASVTADTLVRNINSVSVAVRNELRRGLARKVYNSAAPAKIAGSGGQWLKLPRWPIESVQAVRVGDQAITDYERTEKGDDNGLLFRQGGWPMVAGVTDYITFDIDTRLQSFNIEIEYIGGWVLPNATPVVGAIDLPWDIRQAVYDEVWAGIRATSTGAFAGGQRITEERTAGGWSRKYADTSSVKGGTAKRLSSATMDILANYAPKRWA